MKPVLKAFALLVLLLALIGAIGVWYIMTTGLSAREEPGSLEEFAARRVRTRAIARRARSLTNPVKSSGEVIAAGRAHFADHCAICHANDGSGDTEMGRGMHPRAPDMRLSATQDLSDGELFWIIENGIRFTGMPRWSTGHDGRPGRKLASGALHSPPAEADASRARGDGIAQSAASRSTGRGKGD